MRHPLVRKEWRTSKWIMLGFGFVYTMFLIMLSNSLYKVRTSSVFYNYEQMFFIEEIYRIGNFLLPISLIGIVVLVVMLFSDDKNLKTSKFIASLPFTRKTQFIIKYITGLTTFTVPLMAFGLIGLKIRNSNIHWINRVYKFLPAGEQAFANDSLGMYIKWVFTIWLIMIAFYSFLTFVQTLMGQNIIAGVVGGVIWLTPWFLIGASLTNLDLIFSNVETRLYMLLENSLPFILLGNPRREYDYFTNLIPREGVTSVFYDIYTYEGLGIYIVILVAVVLFSYSTGMYFYLRNDLEKNGEIAMYNWVKVVLVAGVTICSGLLLPMLFVIFTQIESALITIALLIVGGAVGYVLSSRGIELSRQN